MQQNRINTRLPEILVHHVDAMCGEEGFYENASEFVRDLIRQHYEKVEKEKWQRLKIKLAEALETPEEECFEIDPKAHLEELKKRYQAQREAV